jgi:hypothetical protein
VESRLDEKPYSGVHTLEADLRLMRHKEFTEKVLTADARKDRLFSQLGRRLARKESIVGR